MFLRMYLIVGALMHEIRSKQCADVSSGNLVLAEEREATLSRSAARALENTLVLLFAVHHDVSLPCEYYSSSALGVVEYVSRDDMRAAIRTLDDTRLGGKYIRVKEVKELNNAFAILFKTCSAALLCLPVARLIVWLGSKRKQEYVAIYFAALPIAGARSRDWWRIYAAFIMWGFRTSSVGTRMVRGMSSAWRASRNVFIICE